MLLVSAECKLERHFQEYPIENEFSISENDTFQNCMTTFKEIIRKADTVCTNIKFHNIFLIFSSLTERI